MENRKPSGKPAHLKVVDGRSHRETKAVARPTTTAMTLLQDAFRLAAEAAHPLKVRVIDGERIQTSRHPTDEGAPTVRYRRLIRRYETRTRNLAYDLLDELNDAPQRPKRKENPRCWRRACDRYSRRQRTGALYCDGCGEPLPATKEKT